MAKVIKRGETLLIPFRNGVSLSDSQQNPRMYKTRIAFETKCPKVDRCADGVELVEFAEMRHGKWSESRMPDKHRILYLTVAICSECKTDMVVGQYDNYCPNCGAKMDGELDEID